MLTFLDLRDISEQTMEIVNPSSAAKIVRAGRSAGLKPGQRVIDFACGFGETLALWADAYGTGGLGIDIRPNACARAQAKLAAHGLSDRIEIVCGNALDYAYAPASFDVASCLGATTIWGGYRGAIRAMRGAVRPGGRLVIGEVFWSMVEVPPALAVREGFLTEHEILNITRDDGFDFADMVRSEPADWERYETDNWAGFMQWLEAHPDHPDRAQVIEDLRRGQDEYLTNGRYFGWAIFVLTPHLV